MLNRRDSADRSTERAHEYSANIPKFISVVRVLSHRYLKITDGKIDNNKIARCVSGEGISLALSRISIAISR